MASYDVDDLPLTLYPEEIANRPFHPSPIASTIPPITTSPALLARQNADCSNSIIAAVESATVVVSRSFQQSLATASQQLSQASIAASNAIQQASEASASASSFVAGASAQIASLSSSASVAVANASMSLVAVMQSARSVELSASSAVASAQAALASVTGLGTVTQTMTAAMSSSTKSSAVPNTSPAHKSKLLPSQIALVVICSMLASIFITLAISFLLLRHKRKLREAQLHKDERGKERASQRPPTSSLPIAASMSKRVPANPIPLAADQQLRTEDENPVQNPNSEIAAVTTFSAFHPNNEEAFAGELRDRLIRLSSQQPSLVPGPQELVDNSPSPPISGSASMVLVQPAKQVTFSSIRAVENRPAALGEEDDDEGFTVSRTVRRSRSNEGERGKGDVRIGVRTWVESDSS